MSKTGVKVKLIGTDGNAFAIMGRVMNALQEAGMHDESQAYSKYAQGSDSYHQLLQRTMEYVDVN